MPSARSTTRRPARKAVKSNVLTGQALKLAVAEFLGLKNQIAALTKRQDETKKTLKATVESLGFEDDKGHRRLEFDEPMVTPDGQKCTGLINQKRTTQVLNDEVAEKILKKKGIYEECVETIEVLQPDLITKALYQGRLTEAEVDKMFSTSVVWAFIPQVEK